MCECVNVYLFEDLAPRLGFILLTQDRSCSQAAQLTKVLHCIIEQLVQCVSSRKVHQGQRVKMVHGAIGSFYLSFGGFGFESLGLGFSLLGSRDEVPGQEAEHRVHPHQYVHWEQEDTAEVHFHGGASVETEVAKPE